MKRYVRWGFALALLPLAGCGGRGEEAPMAAPAGPPPLASADATFITQAAMGGLDEVQDGQIALQKATRPAVRQFAQQMVTDHTQVNQQLTALAQRKGVAPPPAPDPQQAAEAQKLQGLRGRGFDREFVRDQLTDHQQAVALFQQEAQQGTDPDVKAFAQQTLPTLQQHLQMVQALEGRPTARAPKM